MDTGLVVDVEYPAHELGIRPKILRDSQFRDLQYLSDVDAQDAQIAGDTPISHPLVIPCVTPPTTHGNRSIRAMRSMASQALMPSEIGYEDLSPQETIVEERVLDDRPVPPVLAAPPIDP